jgi:hypothetical protein
VGIGLEADPRYSPVGYEAGPNLARTRASRRASSQTVPWRYIFFCRIESIATAAPRRTRARPIPRAARVFAAARSDYGRTRT